MGRPANRVLAAKEAARVKIRAAYEIREIKRIAKAAETAAGKFELDKLQMQLNAHRILLAKVVPDLKAVEHSGEVKHAVIGEQPLTVEEWEAEHCMGAPAGPASSAH